MLPAPAAVGVLALGVVGLAAVAATPRLPLRLRRAEVGDRVGEAVGLGARLLVPVGSEVRLFLLGHLPTSFRKATYVVAATSQQELRLSIR